MLLAKEAIAGSVQKMPRWLGTSKCRMAESAYRLLGARLPLATHNSIIYLNSLLFATKTMFVHAQMAVAGKVAGVQHMRHKLYVG